MSDPAERRTYDLKWVGIRQRKTAQEELERRQAEASKNERNRATEESVRKQKEQTALLEQLRDLERQRSDYESNIFECSRVIRKLSATLKRLQERDDEDLRKESERNSWWTFITSPIYGKQIPETEEQKQQREFHRLQRVHTKSIKEKDLMQEETKVHNLKDRLEHVTSKIAAVKQKREDAKLADEARMQERVRKEQEARRRTEAQEERERQAKWRAEWEAESARRRKEDAVKLAARQAKEAQDAEEAQRRARAAKDARVAQEKMLAQRLEQRARAAREAAQAAQKTQVQGSSARGFTSTQSFCTHDAFWPKIQGAPLCNSCNHVQRRFAFQCPDCNMIACARCRQKLRGERRKKHAGSSKVDVGLEYEYEYENVNVNYWK